MKHRVDPDGSVFHQARYHLQRRNSFLFHCPATNRAANHMAQEAATAMPSAWA